MEDLRERNGAKAETDGPAANEVKVIPAALATVAMIVVAIDLRPGIVSVGPVLSLIRDHFGLSHGMAALLTSIPDVLMGLLALPTPWLARRVGRDRSILLALFLLFLSMALRAFVQSTGALLITTAGVGTGIAVAGSLIGGFIKARFPAKAAVMMAVYATSLSLGSTLSAALSGALAGNRPEGWRLATGVWSILGISALIAWSVVAHRESKLSSIHVAPIEHHPLPIRNPIAWMIALFFAMNNLLFYSVLAWTATIYRERGYASSRCGLILASFTLVFMLGNPVFGTLSRKKDRRVLLAVGSTLALGGISGLAFAPDAAPFFWVPMIAFGLSGGFTLGMTLPLDNTESVGETNVWNAFTLTIGYVVAATGPLTVGILRDSTGSFHLPMLFLLAVVTTMLLLTLGLRPRRNA